MADPTSIAADAGLTIGHVISIAGSIAGVLLLGLVAIFKLFMAIVNRQADEAKAREAAMAAKINECETARGGLAQEMIATQVKTEGALSRIADCMERTEPVLTACANRLQKIDEDSGRHHRRDDRSDR